MTDLVPSEPGKLEPLDPIALASELSIVIAFPKSRSANLPLVWAIAQGAEAFGMWDVPGRPMYVAGFARTPKSAARAAVLLEMAAGWVGSMCFTNGLKTPDVYRVIEVLKCFQQSSMCDDRRAHCNVIINDPSAPRMPTWGRDVAYGKLKFSRELDGDMVERFIVPCKLIAETIDFQAGHPASVQAQIQAAGVERGCSICPNFDPDGYQGIGTYVRTLV